MTQPTNDKCAVCGLAAPESGPEYTRETGWLSRPGFLDRLGWNPSIVFCPAHRHHAAQRGKEGQG